MFLFETSFLFSRIALIKALSIVILTFLLFACSSPQQKIATLHKSHLPKVPKVQIPGGILGDWRYVGTSVDGIVVSEIDETSILLVDNNIYSFKDRKTINNNLDYKYILSFWKIDCSLKQYLLLSASLYNKLGNLIRSIDYTHNDNVKWLKFNYNAISYGQYKYICLNQNRFLGY